jgi:glycosyltransferase involved in cell wall biosynthesis
VRVTIVAANAGEFDSRLRRTAQALAEDGHRVTIVAWSASGLPAHEELPGPVDVRRVDLDLRLTSALRPFPQRLRRALAGIVGFDAQATHLPVGRTGPRLRALVARAIEIVAHLRRVGPWRDAVLRAVPETDVFHAKALIALPVIRSAARRTGARFVYDVADLHTEAARLARMPAPVKRLVARRERAWVRDAAGLTAVSEAVAAEFARRYGVPVPVVVLNTPPAWRPDDPADGLDDGRLRDAAGLEDGRPIVLYQGGLSVDRGLEELVAALDDPALRERDVAVVLLGYGRLTDVLRHEAAARPGRLVVLDAISPAELLAMTVGAAIGYVGQPGRTLNQRLNLANKLFEYAMAGVPSLVDRGTEHCRLVSLERLGRCVDVGDSASVASGIAALLDTPAGERRAQRAHIRSVALERFTWERSRDGLVGLYRRLEGRVSPVS